MEVGGSVANLSAYLTTSHDPKASVILVKPLVFHHRENALLWDPNCYALEIDRVRMFVYSRPTRGHMSPEDIESGGLIST